MRMTRIKIQRDVVVVEIGMGVLGAKVRIRVTGYRLHGLWRESRDPTIR